jgi:hypothetical protein
MTTHERLSLRQWLHKIEPRMATYGRQAMVEAEEDPRAAAPHFLKLLHSDASLVADFAGLERELALTYPANPAPTTPRGRSKRRSARKHGGKRAR